MPKNILLQVLNKLFLTGSFKTKTSYYLLNILATHRPRNVALARARHSDGPWIFVRTKRHFPCPPPKEGEILRNLGFGPSLDCFRGSIMMTINDAMRRAACQRCFGNGLTAGHGRRKKFYAHVITAII